MLDADGSSACLALLIGSSRETISADPAVGEDRGPGHHEIDGDTVPRVSLSPWESRG